MDNPNPPAGLGPSSHGNLGPLQPHATQQAPGLSPGFTRQVRPGAQPTAPVAPDAPPLTLADLATLSFTVAESQKLQGGKGFACLILERQHDTDPRTHHRTTITTTDPALLVLEAGHTLTITADGEPTAKTTDETK